MKIEKKHIVLASLVLALGAAVYLNWQFSDNTDLMSLGVNKELGEAYYVNSSNVASNDSAAPTMNNNGLTQEQSDYFANARTERQQTQDKVLDIAKEVLTLSEATEAARVEAVEQSAKISGYFAHQANVEGILKAKGFSDCICFISDEGCSVVVLKDEVKDNSIIIIKDVVASQTGMEFDKISIVTI